MRTITISISCQEIISLVYVADCQLCGFALDGDVFCICGIM